MLNTFELKEFPDYNVMEVTSIIKKFIRETNEEEKKVTITGISDDIVTKITMYLKKDAYVDQTVIENIKPKDIVGYYVRHNMLYDIGDYNAIIEYPSEQDCIIKYYAKNGKTSDKEDGPSKIVYNTNGDILWSCFIKKDKKHRIDGPALYYFDKENKKDVFMWYYKDKNHTEQVEKFLKDKSLDWREMNKDQFKKMWIEIM